MSAHSGHLPLTQPASTRVPAWGWTLAAAALFAVFLILQENGTFLSADQAQWLHEFTHDGRHALAVPCH
ncbi:CbtB domain-containing protein [Nocardioides pocheonensis]|uniref:CbtB-domain containing protein n=1 Tax=Nocardioides pocheonensis TaxID=661485 RepID=A0A3N0GGW1_9ACTN|nr:CbtB-domain containing protein [Nocardioides pocheonensis]RNM11703.1 CbtB-domain containing protein [Nocardioides pocheonensis]